MFNLAQIVEDTLVQDAVVVPIKSYTEYVTCMEIMKHYGSHMILPNGVLCYISPTYSGDGEHTWLRVKTAAQDNTLVNLLTIIVSDRTRNESLVTLDNVELSNQVGVSAILQEVDKIIQAYK